jgi:hypothetical protein
MSRWSEGCYPTLEQVERREREARERAAKQAATAAAAERTWRAAESALLPRIERGDVAAMREFIQALTTRHGITIETRTVMPAGASAYANIPARRIVVPPLDGPEAFAIYLHETGHVLAEPCRGGDHQPDRSVTRWHHCVKCESEAWRIALELAPFSRQMFARLQWSLQTYRRKTPAPARALQAADQLTGSLTWAQSVQRRRKHQWRLEALAGWKSDLARYRAEEDRASRERRRRWFGD